MRVRPLVGMLVGLALAATSVAAPAAAVEDASLIPVVVDGLAEAVIVIPDTPGERVSAAADSLAQLLSEVSGGDAPAVVPASALTAPGSPSGTLTRIMLGVHTESDAVIDAELSGLSRDGWLVRAHVADEDSAASIEILAPSDDGVWAGAMAFLERELSVTWLMPWAYGDSVPQRENVSVAEKNLRFEPAFSMGELYSVPENPWIERMGMQRTIDPGNRFSHNLYRIFAPATYATTHPEYYPVVDGVRRIPGENGIPGHYRWNPRFTPETQQVAVDYILDYFEENPDSQWFSLGVNDENGFDDEITANAPTNSLGIRGVSDPYYQWVNAIVDDVTDGGTRFQDKRFGVIAYSALQDPPTFAVNPQVVPFLTKDVGLWVDPEIRDADHGWIEGWQAVTSEIGWYDYTYGTYYAIPRYYPHLMAESYAYLASVGVKQYFTEWQPGWGEGPKAYIMAKLTRDPSLDVDQLLRTWAALAVGEAAAPALVEYYEHWEQFWMERVTDTGWFQAGRKGVYMNVHTSSYLDGTTQADIDLTESLMAQVTSLAVTDDQKARASVLTRNAEIYVAAMASYPKTTVGVASEQEALALLEDDGGVATAIENAALRNTLLDQERARPDSSLYDDPRNFGEGNKWNGVNSHLQTAFVEYLVASEPDGGPVTERIRDLATSPVDTLVRTFARETLTRSVPGENLVVDSSFETQTGPLTAAGTWYAQTLTPGGGFEISDEAARSGQHSVKATDVNFSAISQVVPVSAGQANAVVRYVTPAGTASGAALWFKVALLGADGAVLTANHSYTDTLSAATSAGAWKEARLQFPIPASVGGVAVTDVLLQLEVYLQNDGVPIYADDFEVSQSVSLDTSEFDADRSTYLRYLDTPLGDRFTPESLSSARDAYDDVIAALRQFGVTTQADFDVLVEVAAAAFAALEPIPATVENSRWLSDLPYDQANSWSPAAGSSEGIHLDVNAAGSPYAVRSDTGIDEVEKAIGVAAPGQVVYDLDGLNFNTFDARLAVDENDDLPRLAATEVILPAAGERFAVDQTEFVREEGGDGRLSYVLSTQQSGAIYLGGPDYSDPYSPVLRVTLPDQSVREIRGGESVDVRSWMPDTNLNDVDPGQMQQLAGAGNGTAKTYLSFDVPADLDVADISGAELEMWYAGGTATVTQLTVAGLSIDSWDADGITYNTQPAAYSDADLAGFAPIEFEVYGDGVLLASGSTRSGDTPVALTVAVDDVDELRLVTKPNATPLAPHAVWADARVYALVPIPADETKPTVTLGGGDSDMFDSNAVQLTVSAADNVGVDRIVANLYKNGTLYKSTQSNAGGVASFTHTVDLSTVVSGGLPPGTYVLRYNAKDAAGNVSQTKEFSFTLRDRVKPQATLVTPSSAGPFRTLSIKMEATDAGGLSRVVANIYKNGVLVQSTQTAAHGNTSAIHTATVMLLPGTYSIRYNAQDLSGNVSQTGSRTVTIDPTAPAG